MLFHVSCLAWDFDFYVIIDFLTTDDFQTLVSLGFAVEADWLRGLSRRPTPTHTWNFWKKMEETLLLALASIDLKTLVLFLCFVKLLRTEGTILFALMNKNILLLSIFFYCFWGPSQHLRIVKQVWKFIEKKSVNVYLSSLIIVSIARHGID